MIRGGGKYWPKAGNGAPKASASPTANRTALIFMDAFLIRDLLASRPMTPRPLGRTPSWSPRKQSAYFASPAVRGSRFRV